MAIFSGTVTHLTEAEILALTTAVKGLRYVSSDTSKLYTGINGGLVRAGTAIYMKDENQIEYEFLVSAAGVLLQNGTPIHTPEIISAYAAGTKSAEWTITEGDVAMWNSPAHDVTKLIDGASTQEIYFASNRSTVGEFVQIQFAVPTQVDAMSFTQSGTNFHGIWQPETSLDGVAWVQRGPTVTLGGATSLEYNLDSSTTKYNYFRLIGISGTTSSGPWLYELDLKFAE